MTMEEYIARERREAAEEEKERADQAEARAGQAEARADQAEAGLVEAGKKINALTEENRKLRERISLLEK